MYSGKYPPFQIDANFGFGAAVLAMLVKDIDYVDGQWDVVVRNVVLGPAIPKEWGNGSVKGLRLRGGMMIDFKWDDEGIVNEMIVKKVGGKGMRWNFTNVKGVML